MLSWLMVASSSTNLGECSINYPGLTGIGVRVVYEATPGPPTIRMMPTGSNICRFGSQDWKWRLAGGGVSIGMGSEVRKAMPGLVSLSLSSLLSPLSVFLLIQHQAHLRAPMLPAMITGLTAESVSMFPILCFPL